MWASLFGRSATFIAHAEARGAVTIPWQGSMPSVVLKCRLRPVSRNASLHIYATVNVYSDNDNEAIFSIWRGDRRTALKSVRKRIPARSRVFMDLELETVAGRSSAVEIEARLEAALAGELVVNGPPPSQDSFEPVPFMTVRDLEAERSRPPQDFYSFRDDDGSERYASQLDLPYVVPDVTGDVAPPPARERVDYSPGVQDRRTAIFLTFGQSQAANAHERRHVTMRGVLNFNPFDMQCYRAADPLLGASNQGGSIWTLMGDRLIAEQMFDRVIIIPAAVGGTWLYQWMPGGALHRRLMLILLRLRSAGIAPTAFLWQQGESEGNAEGFPGDMYLKGFGQLVASIRDLGFGAPIYVAKSTMTSGPAPNGEAIRNAQANAAASIAGVRMGPDTDVIAVSDRFDQCHFGAAGQSRAAELWVQALADLCRAR
jgi:hypothetical protein